MSRSIQDIISDNLAMVAEREPRLTGRFYERLFGRHPDLAPMFHRNSRAAQEKMLFEAVSAVVSRMDDTPWLTTTLTAMGAKHREYGVTDDMYPKVAGSLVDTLAEVSGDDWSDEIEKAWYAALGAVADAMIAGSNAAAAE